MSEHREGTLFMILKQGGMIYVFDLESFYGGRTLRGMVLSVKVKNGLGSGPN